MCPNGHLWGVPTSVPFMRVSHQKCQLSWICHQPLSQPFSSGLASLSGLAYYGATLIAIFRELDVCLFAQANDCFTHVKAFQDPCLCQERQKGCWCPAFIRRPQHWLCDSLQTALLPACLSYVYPEPHCRLLLVPSM